MPRVMPHKMQVNKFESLFCAKNPPCDELDMLDIPSIIDRKLSYRENLEQLESAYPAARAQ